MKCLAYGCQNEATVGFPCCDKFCGSELKTAPQQIKKAQDEPGTYYTDKTDEKGYPVTIDNAWTGWTLGLRRLSIGAIEYYAKAAELL